MTKEEQIKRIILNQGADLCGIAGIERFANAPIGFHPSDIYKECKSVIVFAKRLSKGLACVNLRIVYNHTNGLSINTLDTITYESSIVIEQLGCVTVPLPCDSPYEYWEKDNLKGKGILSMRHAAALAGLGSLAGQTHKKFANSMVINNFPPLLLITI